MSGTISVAAAHQVSEADCQSWDTEMCASSRLAQAVGVCLPGVGPRLINPGYGVPPANLDVLALLHAAFSPASTHRPALRENLG